MFSDKIFQIALIISLATHTAIFLYNTDFILFKKGLKNPDVEVNYVSEPAPPVYETRAVAAPLSELPLKVNLERELPLPARVAPEKGTFLTKSADGIPTTPAILKPSFNQPESLAVKRVVTLPPLETDKINNPSYMNYYQLVREKIRRAAYRNFIKTETGEVYLSFIIKQDGTLKEKKLHEDRSQANNYLKQTAIKSLNEAAPFPAFPKELETYAQLSFTVIISFQMDQG